MVRALLRDHSVSGCDPTIALNFLLQKRLIVVFASTTSRKFNFGFDVAYDKLPYNLHASIEKDSSNQRFKHIGQQGTRNTFATRDATAYNNTALKIECHADPCAGLTTHHRRLNLREVALEHIREPVIQHFTHDCPEDSVSEKLETFI